MGLLALVCTDDSRLQLKLKWWKGPLTSSERHDACGNIFVKQSDAPIVGAPDLEITVVPDQCTFSAANGSSNRVLLVECKNLGMCEAEPRCRR